MRDMRWRSFGLFRMRAAKLLNYCRAESFVWAGGKSISGVQLHDAIGQNKLTIQAKIAVTPPALFPTNPPACESERLAAIAAQQGRASSFSCGTFPGKGCTTRPETEDKRVIFAVPCRDASWWDHGR